MPAPTEQKLEYFFELPFQARFSTVSVVELWRGVGRAGEPLMLSIGAHYPVGLGGADPQNLPMSFYVRTMSRNR